MLERRKTERVFLRIPIRVRGVNRAGRRFTERTATVEISRDGARIGLKQAPRPGSDIRLTNLATQVSALFKVAVQYPQSYNGRPEWGVAGSPRPELMARFWGIDFEEQGGQAAPQASAFLECSKCGRQALARLSPSEYHLLRTKWSLRRACAQCQNTSKWVAASPLDARPIGARRPRSGKKAAVASLRQAKARKESTAEQRKSGRFAMKVPVLVKGPTGATEKTQTRDLSRAGLSFPCGMNLAIGDKIQVTLGYGVTDSVPTQFAQVIWRSPQGKATRAMVGAEFTRSVSV